MTGIGVALRSHRVRYGATLWMVCIAVALSATGCSLLRRPLPERQQFVLEAARPDVVPTPAAGPLVLLRPFRPSPRLDGPRFVYRLGTERFVSDFYHVFWSVPEDLVADQARRWLDASGLFGAVVDGATTARPAYLLEGALAELYADFSTGSPANAVIAMRFALIDVARVPTAVSFHRDYTAETVAASDAPEDIVRAWNTGLAEILTSFERDLRSHLDASR